MKLLRISLLLFLVVFAAACKKKKYPDSVADTQSVFYFKATVNNSPVAIGAGVNNYYMYSSYDQDSNNVYDFYGNLKPLNCGNSCANSLRIRFRDTKATATNASINIDSALQVKIYPFSVSPATGYNVSFLSSYNKQAASYLWDFGDGTTSNLTNPQHTYTKGGTYKVCLTIDGTGGCAGSICNTQKIGLTGNQVYINTSNVSGNTITFNPASTGRAPFKYLWDFGDGLHDTLAFPTHTYAIAGGHPVSVRVTDAANDVAYATYNAVTQFDASSCAANYRVTSITPVLPQGYLNLATAGLEWVDANGSVYQSDNVVQPGNSFFQVVSVEDYHENEAGQKTKKVHVRFKCAMSNGSSTITFDDAEAVICVAYK